MPHLSWQDSHRSIAPQTAPGTSEGRQGLALSSVDSRLPLGRVRTWIAATAALVALTLTALAPSAAQANHDNKPSCVELWRVGGLVTRTVYAKNNCSTTKGFIVRKKGADSSCLRVSPGKTVSHRFSKFTAYHGTTWGC